MRSLLFPAFLAGLTCCSPGNREPENETGMAQGGAGGFSSHDTMPSAAGGSPRARAAGASPAAVLSQLYVANTSEIQLSRLAARRATSPTVKRVANTLAADHARNREELRALAQKLNLTVTPVAGGGTRPDSTGLPPELLGKRGRDFDRAFVEDGIRQHEANIEKIQTELLPAAQNPEIKAYLQQTLTAMQHHLAALEQAQQRLGT